VDPIIECETDYGLSLNKRRGYLENVYADPRQQQGAKSESQALCHLETTRRGRFVFPHGDYQKLSTVREGTKCYFCYLQDED
jgi:hypothetical protein